MFKLSKITRVFLILSLLVGFTSFAEAAPKKATYWPKINRADIGINIGDVTIGGTYGLFGTGLNERGQGWNGVLGNSTCNQGGSGCYIWYAVPLARSFGLDSSTRLVMSDLGYNSDLAHLFYLAIDAYFAGGGNSNFGSFSLAAGVNAGFTYPLLAISGYNKFLASNKPQPINLNLFFELGLGYLVNIVTVYGADQVGHFHSIAPGIALGLNMQFKTVPDLELEVAYKLLPGWRSNAYARLQYDFLTFGKNKKLGVHFLFDVAILAANTGFSFRF